MDGSWRYIFDYHINIKSEYHVMKANNWFKLVIPKREKQNTINNQWKQHFDQCEDDSKKYYQHDKPMIEYLREGLSTDEEFLNKLVNSWIWKAYLWAQSPITTHEFNDAKCRRFVEYKMDTDDTMNYSFNDDEDNDDYGDEDWDDPDPISEDEEEYVQPQDADDDDDDDDDDDNENDDNEGNNQSQQPQIQQGQSDKMENDDDEDEDEDDDEEEDDYDESDDNENDGNDQNDENQQNDDEDDITMAIMLQQSLQNQSIFQNSILQLPEEIRTYNRWLNQFKETTEIKSVCLHFNI